VRIAGGNSQGRSQGENYFPWRGGAETDLPAGKSDRGQVLSRAPDDNSIAFTRLAKGSFQMTESLFVVHKYNKINIRRKMALANKRWGKISGIVTKLKASINSEPIGHPL